MRARTTPGTGASAPATEQAQPPQTAEPPSKKARRKATTALNSSAVLEDISEGEEGFPLTDEDDGETLDSDFSDFTDEDDEEEDMISIRRGLGPSGDLEEGEIPTTTTAAAAAAAAAAPKRGQGKKSRWDQQVRTAAPLKGVRDAKPAKTASQNPKQSRRSASLAAAQTQRPRAPRRALGQQLPGDASAGTHEKLRELIFPTLYAIFQQSRAQRCHLKVKNRSLRSLTRSCLYHNREEQLQRTLADSEALLSKYCSGSAVSHPARPPPVSYTETPAKEAPGPASLSSA
ncbi:33K protein [reindeer adenovirus 1]|uniref:33K protein n=1 Tax=reindeer adenovirus 1 TaxID=2885353 RepID=A0AAE8Y3R6_9ADEN|nr:33K protein [reindeer adenovirus 1]